MRKLVFTITLLLMAAVANAQTFDVVRLIEGHAAKFGSEDIKWKAPQSSNGKVEFDAQKKVLVIRGVSEVIDGTYLFPDTYVPYWKKPADRQQASEGIMVMKTNVKHEGDGQSRIINMYKSSEGVMNELVMQAFSGSFKLELAQRKADDEPAFTPEVMFKPLPDLGYRKKGRAGYAGLHYANVNRVGISFGQGAFLTSHTYIGGGIKAIAPTFEYNFVVGKRVYIDDRMFQIGPYFEFREYFMKSRFTPMAGLQAGFYAGYLPNALSRKWGGIFDVNLLLGANWSIGEKSGFTFALTWDITHAPLEGLGLAVFYEF